MHWHFLAFAVIPVWVWLNMAMHRPVLRLAENNDDRWWGGFPLSLTAIWCCGASTLVGAISIGFYAVTGKSPFS